MGSLITTQISTSFNLDIVQVEVSTKCILKCPRCPRTELDLPWINQEITLEQFKTTFPPEVLAQIKYLWFCGHSGDPIYAREFLEIIKYIKSVSKTRSRIITNGSYKKADWWIKLGQLLDKNDGVTFSIDGYDHASNNLYRVDSNWASIIEGLTTLRTNSSCYITWSTIYFNFNQQHVDRIAQTAKDLGCDVFQLVKSAKFDGRYLVNGIDPLKPTVDVISKDNNYERNKIVFGRDDPFIIEQTKNVHPFAKCLNGARELNVTVDGYVYPCGWFNTGYQENDFVEKYRDRINVYTRSLKDVLEDPLWSELLNRFDTNPLEICRIKCQNCEKF